MAPPATMVAIAAIANILAHGGTVVALKRNKYENEKSSNRDNYMYVVVVVCAAGIDSNWMVTFLGDVEFVRAWLFGVAFWLKNRLEFFSNEAIGV